jgi:hypothetical protein
MDRQSSKLWLARLLIFIVTAWNLQAAIVFFISPEAFAPGFELSGVPGTAAVRGIAVLFLMWNVPYLAALWHPQRYKLALKLAVVMQLVGVVGESFISAGLTAEHALLQASILRFIIFDAAGLVLLRLAFWLAGSENKLWGD